MFCICIFVGVCRCTVWNALGMSKVIATVRVGGFFLIEGSGVNVCDVVRW